MSPELYRHLEKVLAQHNVKGTGRVLAHSLVEVYEVDEGSDATRRAIDYCASQHDREIAIVCGTDLWRFLVSLQLPCPIPLDEE